MWLCILKYPKNDMRPAQRSSVGLKKSMCWALEGPVSAGYQPKLNRHVAAFQHPHKNSSVSRQKKGLLVTMRTRQHNSRRRHPDGAGPHALPLLPARQ
jgi:hypothetical protein